MDTKYIIGFLTLVILISGTVYISMEGVKLRVDDDKSTFYVKLLDENGEPSGRWLVAGREYGSIFEGSTKINRDAQNVIIETEIIGDSIIITRTTPYIKGPIIIDKYEFDGKNNDVELFPIYHEVKIINGSGFFYRYEVRDLDYDGPTLNLVDVNSMEFGKNMKITWQEDYYWSWVYKSGIFKVQYKIDSDEEIFNVRFFDPVEVFSTYDSLDQKVVIVDKDNKSIANVTLLSELHRVIFVDDYAAEFEVDNFKDNVKGWVSDIDFYEKYSKDSSIGSEILNKSFNWKYYNPEGTSIETIYIYENLTEGMLLKEFVLNYSYNITINGSWDVFDEKTNLPKGTVKLRAYYPDLKPGEIIEFVPTFFGVRVDKWASFEGATKYEWYEVNGDTSHGCYGAVWRGQSFTVGTVGTNESFSLAGVAMKLFKQDTPGYCNVSIYALSAGIPTGSPLTTNNSFDGNQVTTDGGGEFYNITLPEITLTAGTSYGIMLSCLLASSSSDDLNSIADQSSSAYTGGSTLYSVNNGVDFSASTDRDDYFQVYGIVAAGDDSPSVNLSVPVNDYESSSHSILFNCTAYDDNGLSNNSLFINGVWNYTVTNITDGQTELSLQTTVEGLAIGTYNWTCKASDNLSQQGISSARNFTVIKSLNVTLNAPVDHYNSTSRSVTINCSMTGERPKLNLSLWIDGVINYTIFNTTAKQNLSLETTVTNFASGTYDWSCDGWDDTSHDWADANRTLNINLNATGTVKDENSNLLSNVSVFIINQTDNSLVGNVTTNESGDWTYGPLPSGTYTIGGYEPTNSSRPGDLKPHIVIP